jgi:hypothetical protein
MEEPTATESRRRSRADLKELMLDAGVVVLDELGVEVQISSVGYARVFEHLERTAAVKVTYGSVHERIWDSVQDYQLDVIERAALWDTPADDTDDWTSWLRTAVAFTSQPDGPVVDAAINGNQERYARLDRLAEDALDPGIPDEGRAATARLSTAIREGLNLRQALTGEPPPPIMLPTGPNGEPEEWSAGALVAAGVSAVLAERDEG